jgi:quercetin dioxygenase-like cupin family protein
MVNLYELKKFYQQNYARHLVVKSQNVEIILVCWLPGQASPVHGHGPSDSVIMVLEGELSYTNYYPNGRKVSGTIHKGDISHAPVGVEHQIANNSNNELVTLHIYSPPLNRELQGFDLGYANQVELQEVQLPEETVRYLVAARNGTEAEPVDPGYAI